MTALATSLAVTTLEEGLVEVRCSSPVPAAPGTYPIGNADDDDAAAVADDDEAVAGVSVSMTLLAAALALSLSEVALSLITSHHITYTLIVG